jgi:hypothetical protein
MSVGQAEIRLGDDDSLFAMAEEAGASGQFRYGNMPQGKT